MLRFPKQLKVSFSWAALSPGMDSYRVHTITLYLFPFLCDRQVREVPFITRDDLDLMEAVIVPRNSTFVASAPDPSIYFSKESE
jgi:hypothetical protein